MISLHLRGGWSHLLGFETPDERDSVYRIIDRPFAFMVPGAKFSKAFRNHTWDGKTHLVRKARVPGQRVGGIRFPTGLWPEIVDLLVRKGVEFVRFEERPIHQPLDPSPFEQWNPAKVLRPYQEEAVDVAVFAGGGILRMPARSGKTLVAAAVIRRLALKTLFVVTSDLLLKQGISALSEALPGARVTGIGDGEWDDTGDIVVATIQTLVGHRDTRAFYKLNQRTGVAFQDECLVSGTLVDGRAIESIKVGDIVRSFDPSSGQIVSRKVLRTFRSRPHHLVRVTIGDVVLSCTPGHPFLAKRGWIPAVSLRRTDLVRRVDDVRDKLLSMRGASFSAELDRSGGSGLLSDMSRGDPRKETESGNGSLSNLRISDSHVCEHPRSEGRASVLLRRASEAIYERRIFSDYGENKQDLCVEADDRTESDETTGDPQTCLSTASGDWTSPSDPRRQWDRADSSPKEAARRAPRTLGGGGDDPNICPERAGRPFGLQGRYRLAPMENRDRSRRWFSLLSRTQEARREKDFDSDWAQVDRVEIQKPTGDGRFGGLCPDGFVYNLEIEGTMTYIAGGIVVHNCHHYATGGKEAAWRDTALSLSATHIYGLSATVEDDGSASSDMGTIWLRGICGPVIFSVAMRDLVEQGHLVKTTIRWIAHEAPETLHPEWSGSTYSEEITNCEPRNRAVVDVAVREAEAGSRVLVDVTRINHTRLLTQMCRERLSPKQVAMLTGKSDDATRKAALAGLKSGDVRIIVGTILGEGVDIPELNVVVNAEGGKAKTTAIQRLRNMTKSEGKREAIVYEMLDLHHPHLAKWTAARHRVYKAEQTFKIEMADGALARKRGGR